MRVIGTDKKLKDRYDYSDPTAYKAMKNYMRTTKKEKRNGIKDVSAVGGKNNQKGGCNG